MRTARPIILVPTITLRLLAIVAFAISATSCALTRQPNSLRRFVQDGPRTVFEVIDNNGKSWTVGSVEAPSVTTYFVLGDGGQVDLIASAFDERARATHALVFVNTSRKEETLAVLDRKFLFGVANTSESYKAWVAKNAVFTFGSVQNTQRIDVDGPLGASDIRIEGGAIVGLIKNTKCHCFDFPGACAIFPSTYVKCYNFFCDYLNCVADIHTNCSTEAERARFSCRAAIGEEP